ncbi:MULTISPECIES: hypothetical protein [Burkholderia]|jgi:hypothetical protein|nr:hypothetical protein [Burkholderia cenocepacia]HDR9800644.1 hypothetical protein [Burkholderia cenocepacia]
MTFVAGLPAQTLRYWFLDRGLPSAEAVDVRTMTQQVACARARGLAAQFGYYPVRCDIQNGRFSVETLPDLDSRVADVAENENVHSGWIYAGAEQVRDFMTGNVTVMPYSARVFPLPKTHVLTIKKCESRDHLELVVWCLSFFIGMRLTTTEAGFLDATPVEPGKLVDFSLGRYTVEDVIVIALNFLDAYRKTPPAYKILPAVIHALFLAQYPQSLDFERFQYLYMALDACYKLMTVNDTPPSRSGHAARIQWMCEKFTVPVPEWAKVEKKSSPLSIVRNDAIHEGLFFNVPLGFAIYGGGVPNAYRGNVPLEMRALVCRLLVGVLVGPSLQYVSTPVDTRQRYALDRPA